MNESEDQRKLSIPGYELLDIVGIGGMSVVWRAWDQTNQRTVAIKVLNHAFSARGEDVRAFRCEEQVMEEIDNPGVVKAYDFEFTDGHWYLVMEFVDGYTFQALLDRKGFLSEQDTLLICESVAVALDDVWNNHGLVHCDLKPENIMINSSGVVKLTDLGIAHRFKASALLKEVPEQVTGTPAYISPEHIYGDVELDCRADIYSLGATLYHLATGKMIFAELNNEETMRAHCDENSQAPDPRAVRPGLSEGFARMLEAMLVKRREGRLQRWQDVYQFALKIERGEAITPRTTGGASSIALRA